MNVPAPEEIVAEAVVLVRPGGAVAFHEADWVSHVCDPPLPAFDRLIELFHTSAQLTGINLSIGRAMPQGLTTEPELADLTASLRRHIDDPGTLLISHLFVQAWGRKPW